MKWARGGRIALACIAASAVIGLVASSALAFRASGFSVAGTSGVGLVYKTTICGLRGVRTKVVAGIRPASGGTTRFHTWHVVPHFKCTGFTLRASDPFPPGDYVTTLGVFAHGSHVILPGKAFHNN